MAHDRRHLVRLLGVAFLALHPRRDGHHDDDDEHRDSVREDVDESHAREVGHAPEGADGGCCPGHGDCSAYSRIWAGISSSETDFRSSLSATTQPMVST